MRALTGGHALPCQLFLQRLADLDRPIGDLVANVNTLAVGSSVSYAQAVAQIVDFYLDDNRQKEREALIAVCARDDTDPEVNALLKGYVREAMRLNPQYAGLFRTAAKDGTIVQGDGLAVNSSTVTSLPDTHVKAGDVIFGSFKNAHLNVRLLVLPHFTLTFHMSPRDSTDTCFLPPAGRLPEPRDRRTDSSDSSVRAAG